MSALPTGADERNEFPMADGLLYYFPAALAAVARVSKVGNEQHNAGQPMHWARGKSMDHANKIIRHQLDAGTFDSDGQRHSAKVAWRALAQLQEELEREEGAPLPRNARVAEAVDLGVWPMGFDGCATGSCIGTPTTDVIREELRKRTGVLWSGQVTRDGSINVAISNCATSKAASGAARREIERAMRPGGLLNRTSKP